MTDNEATVAVPVSLIEQAYEQSGNKISESLGLIYKLAHPKPSPSRLRVVDLEWLDAVVAHRDWATLGAALDRYRSTQDVTTIIEQAVDTWYQDEYGVNNNAVSRLKVNIGIAIGEATR